MAAAADKRQREAAAREIEIIGEGFASSAVNVVAALAALSVQTEKMVRFMPDAMGLNVFVDKVRGELPSNISMLTTLLRSYTDGVLNGAMKATLPGAPIIPQTVIAPPPTTQVFSVREISWTDANGQLQLSHRWRDVSLPPETAQKALSAGAVVSVQHELRRKHLGQHNFTPMGQLKSAKPAREACFNLDGDAPPDAKAVAALAKPSASVTPAWPINPAPATKSDPRVTGEP